MVKSSHEWEELDANTWNETWPGSEVQDLPEPMHGSSLLHKLKEPRDCSSLTIPFEYCQCEWKFTAISASTTAIRKNNELNGELMKQMVEVAVAKMNSVISSSILVDKCAHLVVSEKEGHQMQLERFDEEQKVGEITTFRLIFETEPGNARYSAFIQAKFVDTPDNGLLKLEEGSILLISDPFQRLICYLNLQ